MRRIRVSRRARNWRWATMAVVVGVLAALIGGGPAAADATGGRNASVQPLTCGGVALTVVTPSGPAAAGQVVDASGTLVVADLTLTLSFTDPDTGLPVTEVHQITYASAHGAAEGLQDRLVTCEGSFTVNDPDVGPIAVTLVGEFVLAPKG